MKRKMFDYGFTYYVASYGPRMGDPILTYVSLIPTAAVEACEIAMEWEMNELHGYCEDEECDGTCCFCEPDLALWDGGVMRVKDLFTPAELMEHRRDLLAGRAVALYR